MQSPSTFHLETPGPDPKAAQISEQVTLLQKPKEGLLACPTGGPEISRRPWTAWALLAAAIISVSSAAVTFASMTEVPPVTLAAWRLQLTSFLLAPGAVYQYRHMPSDQRQQLLRSVPLMLASGTFLALHFACWVWSIDHTSLPHALLFVSSTPITVAAGMLLLRKPIFLGEVGGSLMALGGMIVLTHNTGKDQQVTIAGDLSALGAATFVIGYLSIGRMLRAWMPLYLYAAPVTGIAALLLSLAAIPISPARPFVMGTGGLVGWLLPKYLPRVLWLAVGPGIMGHTGLNAVLKYFPVLFISLAVTTEPAIGTLMGWVIGLVEAPTIWTWAGGTILLSATAVVTLAMHQRGHAASAKGNVLVHEEAAFPDIGYLQQVDLDMEQAHASSTPVR
ncbi:hypothetical protein WJX74_006823 [Apatococcus lobatus]|uniref:EamA domain-containing protein n=1 Tax=Apatococcus lobatus TaxID=904363 RepID=A0AAW1QTR9_9CHLO